jgi:outer membrane protein assembly complex protein YaeT
MRGRKLFSNLNNPSRTIFFLTLLALAVFTQPVWAAGPNSETQADFPIGFEGQKAITEPSLKEAAAAELSSFYKNGLRRADADDAAFQMERLYRQSGFAFAKVSYRYAPVLGKPGLLFTLSEGPRVELQTISLTGNSAYAAAVLLPFYEGKHSGFPGLGRMIFNKTEIDSGASGIHDYYLSEGYLEVTLDPPQYEFSPDRSRVTVKQIIHKGVRYLIHDIAYTGDLLEKLQPSLEEIKLEITEKPFYRRQELALKDRILQLYGDEGYADATVTVEASLNSTTGQVSLQARIRSGLLITLTQVEVFGNTVTQTPFILSRLPAKPGQLLRRNQTNQGFSNLYATGLFSKVDLSLEKNGNPRERILQVAVYEVPYKELFFEAGYGSYEWLRILAGFKEKNIFGTGRIFRTEAGASFKGENTLIGLTDPWFLNTEVTGDLSVFYRRREEPEYISQKFGSTAQFSKQLFEHMYLSLGYTLDSTHLFNLQADADLQGIVANYQTGAIILQTYYDTRNNALYPSAGQKTSFSSEFSTPVFGSQITYNRFTFGTQWFLPITASSVLALRYDTGLIVPGEGLDVIPLDRRFYNGGANSVRSFQENEPGPVDPQGGHPGGLANNVVNLEWRQHLAGDVGINLFFDTGNISPNRSREQVGVPIYTTRAELMQAVFSDYFADFRSALGVGLEYFLPIGPARLDFGFNPNPSTTPKEAAYALHFSIGMVF